MIEASLWKRLTRESWVHRDPADMLAIAKVAFPYIKPVPRPTIETGLLEARVLASWNLCSSSTNRNSSDVPTCRV